MTLVVSCGEYRFNCLVALLDFCAGPRLCGAHLVELVWWRWSAAEHEMRDVGGKHLLNAYKLLGAHWIVLRFMLLVIICYVILLLVYFNRCFMFFLVLLYFVLPCNLKLPSPSLLHRVF